MASCIFLGGLYGRQSKVMFNFSLGSFRGTGKKAEIGKGNIIEGIEAKE